MNLIGRDGRTDAQTTLNFMMWSTYRQAASGPNYVERRGDNGCDGRLEEPRALPHQESMSRDQREDSSRQN
jgi:hypothetical protein